MTPHPRRPEPALGPAGDPWLGGCSWPDVGGSLEMGRDLLAVPLGATEQHGPHLPLSTDTELAVELCRHLAVRRGDTLVAPALAYGSSGEHAGFPGTLSIGQEALELVLVELARSAGAFRGVIFVNGHGGNVTPLEVAATRLRDEGRPVRAWTAHWRGDAHAGRSETSLALALVPGSVRLERAEPGEGRPLAEILPALRRSSVRAVSANGVLGDPAGASAAEGRGMLAELGEELAGRVEGWFGPPRREDSL